MTTRKCNWTGCKHTEATILGMVDHMLASHEVVRGPDYQRAAISRALQQATAPLSAQELAQRFRLDTGRARDLLNDLVNRGWVAMHQGKPRLFSWVADVDGGPVEQ